MLYEEMKVDWEGQDIQDLFSCIAKISVCNKLLKRAVNMIRNCITISYITIIMNWIIDAMLNDTKLLTVAAAILQLSFWLSIKALPVTLILIQSCCRMSHKPWFGTLSNVGLWPKTRSTQIVFLITLAGNLLGIRSSFQIERSEHYKEICNLFSAWKMKYITLIDSL